jgi:hypothetical protein
LSMASVTPSLPEARRVGVRETDIAMIGQDYPACRTLCASSIPLIPGSMMSKRQRPGVPRVMT